MNDYFLTSLNIRRAPVKSWNDNFQLIEEIYAQFDALGISILASSRIRAYRDTLLVLRDVSQRKYSLDQHKAENILKTIVDFDQLQTIIKAVKRSGQSEMWQAQLHRLISGSAFAAQEITSPSAHDFQFESFLGAVCGLSDYSIRFNEPDIVIQEGECIFGVAAKRPRSIKSIEKNCRKAKRQIRKSDMSGIVALDLSAALYPNRCINTNDIRGAIELIEQATNDFIVRNRNKLESSCRDDSVFAILIQLHLPVLTIDHILSPQINTAKRWAIIPLCSIEDKRMSWISTFMTKCEIGLFGERTAEELTE